MNSLLECERWNTHPHVCERERRRWGPQAEWRWIVCVYFLRAAIVAIETNGNNSMGERALYSDRDSSGIGGISDDQRMEEKFGCRRTQVMVEFKGSVEKIFGVG